MRTPSLDQLEERSDFVPFVLDITSAANPAVIVNGDLSDGLLQAGRFVDVGKKLVQQAVLNAKHDIVLVYNAAEKTLRFGDEVAGVPEDDLGMREDFTKLKIEFAGGRGEQVGPVARLLDIHTVTPKSSGLPDTTMIKLLRELVETKGKKVLLVIEEGQEMFNEKDTITDTAHNAAAFTSVLRTIKERPGSNVVIFDRANGVNGRLAKELPTISMPASTKADVRRILETVIHEEGLLVKAIQLATRTRLSDLCDLVQRHRGPEQGLIQKLIDFKAQQIVKMSGGLLEASLAPVYDNQMALTHSARKYWKGVASRFHLYPNMVQSGQVVVGPPGTGKSIIPKWIAAQVGVPYIKLSDLGTEKYAGVSLQKAKTVFDTIYANKPCVLHIDEMNLVLPKKDEWGSNNDAQVRGYVQDKLADAEFMRGILVIGTSNDPDELDGPMQRSGRFNKRVAMLPPATIQERVTTFKAVWYQLSPCVRHREGAVGTPIPMPDDDFLCFMVKKLPYFVTGSDLYEMIQNSHSLFTDKSTSFRTINEALWFQAINFDKSFKKPKSFDSMVRKSIELHTAYPLKEEGTEEVEEMTESELMYAATQRLMTDMAAIDRGVREGRAQFGAEVQAAEQAFAARQAAMDSVLDAAQSTLRARSTQIDAMASAVEQSKGELLQARQRFEHHQREAEVAMDLQFQKLHALLERAAPQLIERDLSGLRDLLVDVRNLRDAEGPMAAKAGQLRDLTDQYNLLSRTIVAVLKPELIVEINEILTELVGKVKAARAARAQRQVVEASLPDLPSLDRGSGGPSGRGPNRPSQPQPTGIFSRVGAWIGRHRWISGLIGVGAVVGIGALATGKKEDIGKGKLAVAEEELDATLTPDPENSGISHEEYEKAKEIVHRAESFATPPITHPQDVNRAEYLILPNFTDMVMEVIKKSEKPDRKNAKRISGKLWNKIPLMEDKRLKGVISLVMGYNSKNGKREEIYLHIQKTMVEARRLQDLESKDISGITIEDNKDTWKITLSPHHRPSQHSKQEDIQKPLTGYSAMESQLRSIREQFFVIDINAHQGIEMEYREKIKRRDRERMRVENARITIDEYERQNSRKAMPQEREAMPIKEVRRKFIAEEYKSDSYNSPDAGSSKEGRKIEEAPKSDEIRYEFKKNHQSLLKRARSELKPLIIMFAPISELDDKKPIEFLEKNLEALNAFVDHVGPKESEKLIAELKTPQDVTAFVENLPQTMNRYVSVREIPFILPHGIDDEVVKDFFFHSLFFNPKMDSYQKGEVGEYKGNYVGGFSKKGEASFWGSEDIVFDVNNDNNQIWFENFQDYHTWGDNTGRGSLRSDTETAKQHQAIRDYAMASVLETAMDSVLGKTNIVKLGVKTLSEDNGNKVGYEVFIREMSNLGPLIKHIEQKLGEGYKYTVVESTDDSITVMPRGENVENFKIEINDEASIKITQAPEGYLAGFNNDIKSIVRGYHIEAPKYGPNAERGFEWTVHFLCNTILFRILALLAIGVGISRVAEMTRYQVQEEPTRETPDTNM